MTRLLAFVLIAGAILVFGYRAFLDPNSTFGVGSCAEYRGATTGAITASVTRCLGDGGSSLLDGHLVQVECPDGFEWQGGDDPLCERVP